MSEQIAELEQKLQRQTKKIETLLKYALRAKRFIERDVAALNGRLRDAKEERDSVSATHPLWRELDTETRALAWAVMILERSLSERAFEPPIAPEPESW